MKTILVHEYVTGGGLAGQDLPASLAAEGQAIRRVLASEFSADPDHRVVVTLDDRLPDEPGPWSVVRVGEGEELDMLAMRATESDAVLLVAPETNGRLRERAELIEDVAGRSLGSTSKAIALTGDKLRLAAHLTALGIPTPESRAVDPSQGPPGDLPYPVVVKPIDGAGSEETYYVDSARAWPSQAPTRSLVQPYVPGQPLSVSLLVGSDGRPHLVGVSSQRMERPDRRFRYLGGRVPRDAPAAAATARRAVESIRGLRGWVGVDLIWEPATARVTLLEINPRPTTSIAGWSHLLRPAGRLARLWLRAIERPGRWAADELAAPFDEFVEFAADGTILQTGKDAR